MRQKIYVDIKLYDENMRTIYRKSHYIAEKAMKEADNIINKKIRGK